MADVPGLAATRSVTFIDQAAVPDTYVGEGTLYSASGVLSYKSSNGTVYNLQAGGGGGGGTVTSIGMAGDVNTILSWTSSTTNPITTAGVFTPVFANQNANQAFLSPNGTTGSPTFRKIVPADTSGFTTGTVTSVTFTGDGTVLSATPSAAVTSSGTVTATLAAQTGNVVLASPVAGGSGAPTYRKVIAADMVGTGGTINQVLTNQGAGAAPTWVTPSAGASSIPAVQATATVAALNTAYYSGTATVAMTLPAPSTITAGQMATIQFYNNGTGAITITGAVYYGTTLSSTNVVLVGRGSFVTLTANSTDSNWVSTVSSGIVTIN